MRRSFVLWVSAFIITSAFAVYQRMTGPTYPVTQPVTLNGREIQLRFERSHGGEMDFPVRLSVGDATIRGIVEWKRHNTADPWTQTPMTNENGVLSAFLPHQPPAGKLDYRVILHDAGREIVLPAGGPIVVRFKGTVPTGVLVVHVLVIFGAMLLSTRTGLEIFTAEPRFAAYTLWTVGLLFVGGLILGPIVQKYAFDAYWTGWPFGTDLTDNKTAAALLAWVTAAIAQRRGRNPRPWVIAAAIITIVVFLIPHSAFGSEFNYNTLPPPGTSR